jgi:predicted molibdopterin-dependent oxidoreductase YjgC
MPSENHPVSLGKISDRGWHTHQATAATERLGQPLVRRDGALQPASWDEALDVAAERISALKSTGKALGLLGSARATNEENFLLGKLARAALGTNNIDFSLRAAHGPLMSGLQKALGGCPAGATIPDIAKCQVILLWEGNIAYSHPRAAVAVMMAVKAGAKLVTAGYKRTQMSQLAAIHIQVAPGAEGELVDEMLAHIVRAGLQNEGFARARCAGYDALVEWASRVQISQQAAQAAEWYAEAERAAVMFGSTLASAGGESNTAALASLAALTGHLGRPGSLLLPLVGRSNVRGACDMGVGPDVLPGHVSVADAEARQKFEKAWGRPISAEPGLDAQAMMTGARALIALADDPATGLPAGKAAMDMMRQMDFVVAIDSFPTSVTEVADVVLPAASYAETDGTYTNMEGRVQRLRACVQPAGEARPAYRIVCDLAARLGYQMSYGSPADVLNEIASVTPAYSGLSYEKIEKSVGVLTNSIRNGRGKVQLQAAEVKRVTDEQYPLALTIEGAFDWGSDPLVIYSPILARDYLSERKLYPKGHVEMSREDADNVGVRQNWPVRIASRKGEATLPVVIREDLQAGTMVVPFAFRDFAADVFGGERVVAVRAERAEGG